MKLASFEVKALKELNIKSVGRKPYRREICNPVRNA